MANILREEGLQQGLKQGIQKGKTDALSETAIQLLIERFGKVPQDIKEAIVNTDPVALQPLLANSFKL